MSLWFVALFVPGKESEMKKILLLAFAGILFAASGYASTGGHTKVALIAEACSRIPVEPRKRSTDTLDYAIIHGTCKECHNEEVQHNRSVFP